jgi:tRNA A37 threonylcarbamoyltransferase TsaD
MPKFVVLNNSAMAYILGIESSCDDTSAAVLKNTHMLSNVMASQDVHSKYGGVVPELASRAHQQHIVPVVSRALEIAGLGMQDMDAIAFTRGPGLLGSLLVGTSFAKGLSLAAGIPLIEVNHLTGHVLSHFIDVEPKTPKPQFPFLCLLVSGGHTQILQVNAPLTFDILGQTIDDAVGEAFDKGLQQTLVDILLEKVVKAVKETGIRRVALAGGVSANSGLRDRMTREAAKRHWEVFIPPLRFTTDNAAMIAITGYYKWLEGQFAGLDSTPVTRSSLMTGE